jgi:hypothetical protein
MRLRIAREECLPALGSGVRVAHDTAIPHQELELPNGQAELEDLIEVARLAHELIFHHLIKKTLRLSWQAFEILASLGANERFAILPASREQLTQLLGGCELGIRGYCHGDAEHQDAETQGGDGFRSPQCAPSLGGVV